MNAALLALFRCDAAPARLRSSAALRDSLPDVTQFLDGLVIYALSKEWNDLFSIYVFRLQPLPFCEGTPGLTCTEPQTASVQAVYAGGLLVAAAFAQAVLTQYEARFPSLASCKPMLGYMVGWA